MGLVNRSVLLTIPLRLFFLPLRRDTIAPRSTRDIPLSPQNKNRAMSGAGQLRVLSNLDNLDAALQQFSQPVTVRCMEFLIGPVMER